MQWHYLQQTYKGKWLNGKKRQSRAKLDETVENLEKNAINEEKRKKKMDLPPSPSKQC